MKSKGLYERAIRSIPGGVNSNSRGRSPYPLYFSRGEGAYVYDVDGRRYLDLVLGNGSILFGHDYAPFQQKYAENLARYPGLSAGFETELSIEAAEAFLNIVPAERVRFTNTGTEAIIHVLQIARACTGKNDFALVEGAYNGWVDAVNISNFPPLDAVGRVEQPNAVPGAGGLDRNALASAVILPFNNLAVAEERIAKNKDRLAALILEPVMIDIGFVVPQPGYLQGLREICDRHGVLLVFDELLTGFRVPEGSCQKWFRVEPDLSIFGKAIANGHILAAVCGKCDVMEAVASRALTNFVGTFNGHVYSLAAGLAALELMADGTVREQLETSTQALITRFNASAQKHGVTAVMYGHGGHIHWYFADKVTDYREAAASNRERYARFIGSLQRQDCYVLPNPLSHHAISVSHRQEEIDRISAAMDIALQQLA